MTGKSAITPGLHARWTMVDLSAWRWPNFSARELACKCGGRHCGGEYFHNPDFLDALQGLRDDMGAPLVITSGRRCPGHNAAVRGAPLSQHMLAVAVDVSLFGHDPAELARKAVARGFRGIGFGSSFLHLDWRPAFTPFHYDGAAPAAWKARFGFDPVARLKSGRAL